MDNQNINLNQPDNEDNKNSKSSKAKKIIGKAAALGAAAGLGAAAAVSAEAMAAGNGFEENFAEPMSPVDETLEDVVVEPEVFNPNDIKLDEVDVVDLHEDITSAHSAQNVSVEDVVAEVLSPEPITIENSEPSENIAMTDIDSIYVEPNDDTENYHEDHWDVDGLGLDTEYDGHLTEYDGHLTDIPGADEPDVLDDILYV